MKRSMTYSALALIATLALFAFPAVALAEPGQTQQTICWLSTDEQPVFPESVQQQGSDYRLVQSVVEEIDAQWGQVPAQRTETVSCWPADLESTCTSFASSLVVDADGYQGSIPLV